VVRDSLVPGIQDTVATPRPHGSETVTRQLGLPAGLRRADVYDISGRRVARLGPGLGEIGCLGAGVYFVREGSQSAGNKPQAVRKVVVTR
jgi:hypothetical protein